MYVCICNALRESEIREAARRGVTTADDAYQSYGCSPVCADCPVHLQRILDEEHRRAALD